MFYDQKERFDQLLNQMILLESNNLKPKFIALFLIIKECF